MTVIHVCIPGKQRRLSNMGNRWRQFCACGRFRDVDYQTADQGAHTPWQDAGWSVRDWYNHARTVLEALEWSGKHGTHNVCPSCRSIGPHKEYCVLDRLLHKEHPFAQRPKAEQ